MRFKWALMCGAGALIGAASPIVAKAESAAEAAAAVEVETVQVNGVRKSEGQNLPAAAGALGHKPLLDTPYSITVVDREDIEKRQATTIAQIFLNDPSVFSFATAATTNWWGAQIRGLGVRNYYIDDVPLVLYWGGDFPLESIESVQALKGLTGFMYGFGSPGGVISYQTKRPTAEPMLKTEVGYRSDGVVFSRLDAGGPVGSDGKLGYRINLAREKGTAYNDAGVDRKLGAIALEYEITPKARWYSTLTYEDSNLKHEPFQIYWDVYSGTELPKPTYAYKNLNVDDSYYKAKTLALATGFDWEVAKGWKASLTYGYTRKLHHSNKMFVDPLNEAGDYNGYVYTFAELDQNHFGQAMLQGEVTTGPIRQDIVTGVSYQASSAHFGIDYVYEHEFDGNIYQPQPFLVARDIDFSTEGFPSEERQAAVFASDTLHFGEHWQAILGARYTRYKLLDLDGDPTVESGYQTSAVTPTLAMIYKPAPYASIYGSYVESMEGGSRVSGGYANFGDILPATISRQYEVGLKYEHRGTSLTAAAFRVERANQIDTMVDGLRYLSQDGMTIYKGVEVIGSYRPSEPLRLGLGVIHLDPSIQKVSAGNEAIRGNIPGKAARWQITGNADYLIPWVEGLSVHGGARYVGKAPTDDRNTLFIPALTLVNVGFRYQTVIGGRPTSFTGNINNLLDKKYWGQNNIGERVNGSLSVAVNW